MELICSDLASEPQATATGSLPKVQAHDEPLLERSRVFFRTAVACGSDCFWNFHGTIFIDHLVIGLRLMQCPKCEIISYDGTRFCRNCGSDFENAMLGTTQKTMQRSGDKALSEPADKDPDELIGSGIGSVIMGDGFFMVAVLLSATDSSVSSLLWLLMLIPAFFFFGNGFADVLKARQIRRRVKLQELSSDATRQDLPPPRASFDELIKDSGSLFKDARTERVTREL